MKPVAFVTSALEPSITVDDRLAASALESSGIAVEPAVWDDPAVDWTSFAAVVLRSPWDYHQNVGAFTAWLRRLHTGGLPVWNPPPVVLGNLNKRYLLHLEHRGVSIVPTEFVPRATGVHLVELLDGRKWSRAVVKPAVSLGAFGTWRATRDDVAAHEAAFATSVGQGDVLVQEFCDEVETVGEWSLVFLGGSFSHAVLKRPVAGDFRVQMHFGGSIQTAVPPPSIVEAAEAIVSLVPGKWLYARVDGIERAGRFLLMELELAEPNLYFSSAPEAPTRFANILAALL